MERKIRPASINMLEGPIASRLFLFAWPLALTTMLEQFFNTANVIVLGQFVGKHAMAAVGINIPLIGSLMALLIGLSIGTNVVLARHIGQREYDVIPKTISTSIIASVGLGFLFCLIGEVFSVHLQMLLHVPKDIFFNAHMYLRIYLLALPAISLYNFEAAIMRSAGDSKTPLRALGTGAILNLILVIVLTGILKLGIYGVVGSTVFSYYVTAGLLLKRLIQSKGRIRFNPAKLCFDYKEFKEIIRIGLPSGIQGMVYAFSNVIIQTALNTLGADAVASSAAAFIIEVNINCVFTSFGQAVTTFVSQNYGAGNIDRCIKITRIGLLLNICITGALSILILVFGRELLSLFNKDPEVIRYGMTRIWFVVCPQILNCCSEVFADTMRGYGNSTPPAVINVLSNVGLRQLWIFTAFAHHPTFGTLMCIYPLGWTVTFFVMGGTYFYFKKTFIDKLEDRDREEPLAA